MSLNVEGTSCAHCKAYLFSEDDIVYCPVCGAPHHRSCYESLGHCALEELHGTDREYSRATALEAKTEIEEKKISAKTEKQNSERTVKCRMCGEEYPYEEPSCPKCKSPNFVRMNGFGEFDFLGGVAPETEIAEGVSAEEAKKFVMTNTHRYIPKFVRLNENKKTSWNWLAFLFPNCWLLSRKMYKKGIITSVFLIISALLSYPSYNIVKEIYSSQTLDTQLILDSVSQLPENFGLIFIAASVSLVINILVRVLTALYGDYWYKSYTVDTIKKIREENSDQINEEYRKKGGVNVFMFLLGYFLLNYVCNIIFALL